jgi:hypothetical protein
MPQSLKIIENKKKNSFLRTKKRREAGRDLTNFLEIILRSESGHLKTILRSESEHLKLNLKSESE